MLKKETRRKRIQKSIRKRIKVSAERPRLSIFRSNCEIYAQIIDDTTGKTLAAASSLSKEKLKITKTEKSVLVGKKIAEAALAKGIKTVVFDRGGFLYHGRVKALAEAAREGGLVF